MPLFRKFSMKTAFLLCLVFATGLGFSSQSLAQHQSFDPITTRALLEDLRDNPEPYVLKIEGEFKDERAKKFVEYLQKEILPEYDNIRPCSAKSWILRMMINLGLYRSEAEKSEWTEEIKVCNEFTSVLQTSPAFTEKLRIWAELSEGLTGELADEAREDSRTRVRDAFGPEQQDLLNELSELSLQFTNAQTQVPANKTLSKFRLDREKIARDFKSGEMTFEEAKLAFRKGLENSGPTALGYELYQAAGAKLERMAVIRSLLAKSKGFPTWAAYQLANDEGYDVRYRGVEAQREYLHTTLRKLSPEVRKFLDDRIQKLNLNPEDVTGAYEDLVHPPNLQDLGAHLPVERITPIWLETMKESGFQNKTLGSILVDDRQRENKMANGAYHSGLRSPSQQVTTVNALTLDYVIPPRDEASWKPGLSYIVQTYKSGGASDLRTMFHEGGHALEFNLKHKHIYQPEAYAYVETPSTTMEYFLQDAEFIHAKLDPVNGKKPSLETIQELIDNGKMVMADTWHLLAQRALMDINVWDYDYSQPGAMSFLKRLELVYKEAEERGLERQDVDAPIPTFYNRLSTSHHVSGTVRYIGYVFADLSTRQMVKFVTDELEKQSGSRSWLKQPGLAEILGDRFYAQGWKTKFPENIEKITGRTFDPKVLIEEFFAEMRAPLARTNAEETCNEALK